MNFILGLLNSPLIVSMVIGAIGTYIVTPFLNAAHVQANSKLGEDWNTAIHTALKFAIARVAAGSIKPTDILGNDALMNQVTQIAKDYLNDHANFLSDKLGLQGNQIAESVSARVVEGLNNFVWLHGQIEHIAGGGSIQSITQGAGATNVTIAPAMTPAGITAVVEGAVKPIVEQAAQAVEQMVEKPS